MTSKRAVPSKVQIAELQPFSGLPLQKIVVPDTLKELAAAEADLLSCRLVGFDTESKPCFRPGEVSDGPHVIQLTTLDTAYIFQLHRADCHPIVSRLLKSPTLVKVGFGLKSDRKHLLNKLGIKPRALLDMNTLFRSEGYRKEMGVKAAVAVVFNQKFQKSKRVSTSNWALTQLKANQLLYAANDAYAALKVLYEMNKPDSELLALIDAGPD
ncbi:MAG: 3'-5' exonuclease [Halopseudomonas sp.]